MRSNNESQAAAERSSRLLFFSSKFVIVMNEAVARPADRRTTDRKKVVFPEKYDIISI